MPGKRGGDMPTLTDTIASWEEKSLFPDIQFVSQDTISTEFQPKESAEWEVCIDSLLEIWWDSPSPDSPRPNPSAIAAAIAWIAYFREQFPGDPPTCIIPEPDGGIIVERRVKLRDGHEYLSELTFYNDGRAERTDYSNGRVLQMTSIPRYPQAMDA